MKKHYYVYMKWGVEADELENCTSHDPEFVGETWAVSEAQAINNVRHRAYGDVSQYLPIDVRGHYAVVWDWFAVEAEKTRLPMVPCRT